MAEKKKVYFGWYIVVVSFLLLALVGAPGISLGGLVVLSIAKTLNVNTTAVILAGTISLLGSMLGSVFAGKVLMRFGIRKTVPVLLALAGLIWLGTSFAKNIYVIYVLSVIGGIIGSGSSLLPVSILVNNWFGPKLKGKAMGIVMIGLSAGAIILSPIVATLIAKATWRGAYQMYAIFCWVAIPLVLLTFYELPSMKGLARRGDPAKGESTPAAAAAASQQSGMTAKEALRTPMFWTMALALLLINGLGAAWNGNGPTFLSTIGFDPITASFLMSLCSLAAVVAKILYGIYNDIHGVRKTFNLFLVPAILAGICLICAHWVPMLAYAAAFLYGLSFPNSTVGSPLITSDLFGNKNYGILVGYTQFATSLGSGLLPLLTSAVYSASGSYTASWSVILGLAVLSLVLVNLAYVVKKKNERSEKRESVSTT